MLAKVHAPFPGRLVSDFVEDLLASPQQHTQPNDCIGSEVSAQQICVISQSAHWLASWSKVAGLLLIGQLRSLQGNGVVRALYLVVGLISFALGAVGAFLPLLPTVPLMILAAFCFARSSPALERRIVEHPVMKPHISAWRDRRAISVRGKAAAVVAFAASATAGLLLLPFPVMLVPATVGLLGSLWITGRPTA